MISRADVEGASTLWADKCFGEMSSDELLDVITWFANRVEKITEERDKVMDMWQSSIDARSKLARRSLFW